jgi:uncharacterized membrane protein
MNAAHLHLTLNHLPVVGLIFSLGVLVIGRLIRNDTTMRVSLWSLVATAVLAVPAYLTGEPAEDITERLPGVTHAIVERHEEAAVLGLAGAIAVGVLAAGLLFLARKNRGVPVWGASAIMIAAVAATAAMAWTAKLGGEIRHPEIRTSDMQGNGAPPRRSPPGT